MSRSSAAPRPALWYVWFGLVVFGIIGVIGGIDTGDVGTVVFFLVWTAGFGLCLLRHRRKVAAAKDAEIAARADYEHQQYLRGDDTGVYGRYRPHRDEP